MEKNIRTILKFFVVIFLPLLVDFHVLASSPWPTRSLTESGFDPVRFQTFENYVFPLEEAPNTDGLIIIKDHHLVFERYARNYAEHSKHIAWSITKSFTGALIGIAEEQGYLNRKDTVVKYFPEFASKIHPDLKIQDLLQMRSGIRWNESYVRPELSNVMAMLYSVGFKNMAGYTASLGIESDPREFFRYSSGDTNLLTGILQRVLPESKRKTFAWDTLFDPIGINPTFEQDHTHTPVGASYLYATPRELARFGELILNHGFDPVKRTQVIPTEWVKWSLRLPKRPAKNQQSYGAQWWLNRPISELGVPSPLPRVPENAFFAHGYRGQSIGVFPDQKMVVVRVASEKDRAIGFNTYLEKLLCSLKEAPSASCPESGAPIRRQKLSNTKATQVILPAFYAKEICSCHFVVQRSSHQCIEDYWQEPAVVRKSDIIVDPVHRTVRAKSDKRESLARWVSKTSGCQLVQ